MLAEPDLPAQLELLSTAFTLPQQGDLTVNCDWLPASIVPLLAYRAGKSAPWQKTGVQMDPITRQMRLPAAPGGDYALVRLAATGSLPGSSIIADDESAGFVRYGPSGNWHSATEPTGAYYLGHAYWTYNTTDQRENWGVWTPPQAIDGPHEVFVFIPANYATAANATYAVVHDAQQDVRSVNQSIYWAEWVSLGIHTFSASTASYVSLDDVTGEPYAQRWIAFDAVAFVPVKVHLPLIVRDWPPTTEKEWSGMHMGNRIYSDWTQDMLAPFSPDTGGMWPCIVVAQSNQVFNIHRYAEPDCRISGVSVRNQNLFNYLRSAAQAGTRVVIRITPSPGNFEESIDPGWPDPATRPSGRTLISDAGVRPGGWYQCGNDWRFRPVDDVGDEMLAIQRYVLWYAPPGYSWSVWGFEPANEPNAEWYALGSNATSPALDERDAWNDMDRYFASLYDYVRASAGYLALRVLTPPMAQSAYAEVNNMNSDDCPLFPSSGYEEMSLTFNSVDPKNDGYSWHNYWILGRESWDTCPNGQHVSVFFPSTMAANIDNGIRPAVISEADLASPQQGMGNPVTDKDLLPETVGSSIRSFLHGEERAGCTAAWLLNDDTGSDTDHTWHQAYTSTTGFRSWFTAWWNGDETP